jgi:hypothetical protein
MESLLGFHGRHQLQNNRLATGLRLTMLFRETLTLVGDELFSLLNDGFVPMVDSALASSYPRKCHGCLRGPICFRGFKGFIVRCFLI